MKLKLIGIVLISLMPIAQGSAQLDKDLIQLSSDVINQTSKWIPGTGTVIPALPTPKITLENTHTEVGFPDLSGFHPDCTFTLNNTGNGDGFTTVVLKTDSGAFLTKEEFPVPKNTAATYHMKVNMSLWPIPGSDTVKYNIEGMRSATPEEFKNALEYAVNLGAKTIHTSLSG